MKVQTRTCPVTTDKPYIVIPHAAHRYYFGYIAHLLSLALFCAQYRAAPAPRAPRAPYNPHTNRYHDLSHVPRLRSHGGDTEQIVPFMVNRALKTGWAEKLATEGSVRNFDLFDVLLNGVEEGHQ